MASREENNLPFVQSLEEVGDDHDRKDSSIELKKTRERRTKFSPPAPARRASPSPDTPRPTHQSKDPLVLRLSYNDAGVDVLCDFVVDASERLMLLLQVRLVRHHVFEVLSVILLLIIHVGLGREVGDEK